MAARTLSAGHGLRLPPATRADVRQMMQLVDVASEVVVPAMRAVSRDGEVSAFELRFTDELEGTVASLTARGETFDYLVIQGTVPGMSAENGDVR